MEGPIIDHVVVVVTEAGPHIQMKSSNGEIIATTEVYDDEQWAEDAANRLAEQLGCKVSQ